MVNFLVLSAVTLFGLSFVATKISLEYLSPIEIVAIRMILGMPVLYLALKLKRVKLSFDRSSYVALIPASIILGVHFVIQAVGLIYTTATNTAWLMATIPIFIAILSYIFLKEKLSAGKILGILIASFGVIILISRGKLDSLEWFESVGDWIILLSCITWSIYTIITKNIMRSYDPLSVLFFLLILPTVSLILYTIITTPFARLTNLPTSIIFVLLFHGLFCLGLAHWLWLEGLYRKGAADIGVFLYFEPIVTTVAALLVLDERLTKYVVFGAALVILGICLVNRKPFRPD